MENLEILTAEEARNRTKQNIELDDSVLYPIMERIKEAICKKQYVCYVSAPLESYVIDKLHKLGYKTEYMQCDQYGPRETDMYRIMW